MNFRKHPIAVAALAFITSAPFAAYAAPTNVSFRQPSSGETISGLVRGSDCEVTGSGIRRVHFSIRPYSGGTFTALNTDQDARWYCTLDTTRFANGRYSLRAIAYDRDSGGTSTTAWRTVNIRNGTSTTNTPPAVSITSPANGATVGSTVNYAANATDGNGIRQVQFFLDGATTALATDTTSPYSGSTTLAPGTHTLRAVATDSLGATSSSQVTFTVGNSAPTVNLTAPTSGTVSGTMTFAATASDTDGSIARVEFYLVNSNNQRTLIGSDTTNDYGGTYNTTQLPNGSYQLMAVASDNAGAQSTTQRSVTISNTVNPEPTPTPNPDTVSGGGATTLPANGARAVATFESLGMYWRPASAPGAAGCSIRYRKHSESAWREALAMWYDARNSECRGSIVHLEPGTDYAVEMGVGTNFTAGVNTRTWSENFPIARTVQVQSGSGTVNITEGGTPQGYVLYTGPATLDAANAVDYNVNISAPYVIVRGLTLRGARRDAIRLLPGARDVVIEDNDISGWGRPSGNTVGGVVQGIDREAAIRANCTTTWSLERAIIQRNRMHNPRYGANSWDDGHPLGPVGIEMANCGGNHVIRYNEITSTDGHYFKDGIGGQDNFSTLGFPTADTDIYGNIVSHAWDDGIEAEGGNRNVRIWGNYIDQTAVGIASTVVHTGPAYIFRNVYNRSRYNARRSLDTDGRLYFSKSGTNGEWGDGRRYMFHNTLLQARQEGVVNGLGAGEGIIGLSTAPLTNTVSRNNILHVWRVSSASIRTSGGTNNDLDYDLRNGSTLAYAGAQTSGIIGTPIYRSGHGWQNWAGGNYQLDPSSPGYDRGVRIPNFNDAFRGAGPDMGAHEGDTPAMPLGLGNGGTASTWGGTTTTTSGTTSSTGSTTTSSTDGGVCSTIWCAAQ